jgi:elongation factor 1-beta
VFPHLWAWYVFLSQYTPAARNAWKAAAAPAKPAAAAAAPATEEDDDDFDPFAEDEGDAEAAAKLKEEMAKKKEEKKGPVAKSYVVFEVKPADSGVDLDELAQRIFSEITMEGLLWKTEYIKEPVAYGIFKLLIASTVEDELVSTDVMIERMEELEGLIDPESDEEGEEGEESAPKEKVQGCLVQSVEIKAFNKL